MDVRAGTRVLPKVPGTFFQSCLLGLLRGVYRQTKYVSGASDNIIDEYAIVINMACGGALVMALWTSVLQPKPRSLLGTLRVLRQYPSALVLAVRDMLGKASRTLSGAADKHILVLQALPHSAPSTVAVVFPTYMHQKMIRKF